MQTFLDASDFFLPHCSSYIVSALNFRLMQLFGVTDDEIYVYVYEFLWGSYSAQIKVKIWTKNGKYKKLQEKQFCKRRCFFVKSSSLDEKVILTGDCFFLKVILPEIKIVSFSLEFRCSGAINEFRTGAFPRMFTYSTDHPDLPGHCSKEKWTGLGQLVKAPFALT